SLAETLADAEDYLARGFRVLKLKLGEGVDKDLERTRKLRAHVGDHVKIRVDMNQAYKASDLMAYVEQAADFDIEFIEQPLAADDVQAMRNLPPAIRQLVAVDETL